MTDQILIVEDEHKLAKLTSDFLNLNGFTTHHIDHGDHVIDWVKQNNPTAILLDIMLPGKSGIDLCTEIRTFSQVPILILSAKVEEVDRLLGLGIGADDYICKPFSFMEVVARVKTVLRRANVTPEVKHGLTLDESDLTANYKGNKVSLTAVEFQLLSPLVNHPNQIFPRAKLMENMYSDERIVSERTIDSHIKKLRKKLDSISDGESLIQSVYGVGYRLSPAE